MSCTRFRSICVYAMCIHHPNWVELWAFEMNDSGVCVWLVAKTDLTVISAIYHYLGTRILLFCWLWLLALTTRNRVNFEDKSLHPKKLDDWWQRETVAQENERATQTSNNNEKIAPLLTEIRKAPSKWLAYLRENANEQKTWPSAKVSEAKLFQNVHSLLNGNMRQTTDKQQQITNSSEKSLYNFRAKKTKGAASTTIFKMILKFVPLYKAFKIIVKYANRALALVASHITILHRTHTSEWERANTHQPFASNTSEQKRAHNKKINHKGNSHLYAFQWMHLTVERSETEQAVYELFSGRHKQKTLLGNRKNGEKQHIAFSIIWSGKF